MTRWTLLTFAVLLSPLAVFAQSSFPAGFPAGSVWLSSMSPEEGETVQLYAPVYNSSNSDIEGAVAFSVDERVIGEKPFALDAGDTMILSVDWKAREGDHTISVSVVNAHRRGSTEPLTLQEGSGTKVAVSVDPAPPSKAEQLTQDAAAYLTSVSPEAVTILGSIGETTEGLREASADYIREKLEEASPVIATSVLDGEVLGTSTEKAAAPAISMLDRIWQGFLTILLYICEWQFLFYIVLLFVAYLLFKVIGVFFTDRRNRI